MKYSPASIQIILGFLIKLADFDKANSQARAYKQLKAVFAVMNQPCFDATSMYYREVALEKRVEYARWALRDEMSERQLSFILSH